MFELGVRSAASDQITVSLIDRTATVPESVANLNEQLLQLKQFFSPIEYDPVGGPGQFEAVRNLLEVYEGRAITDIPKLFEIANEHRTFSKASEAVRTEIDPGLQPVEDLLSAAARALARHADQQPGVLFGSDPRIGQLAQQAAIERLLASWYFVKYRRLALDPADKKSRELLDDLGNDLLARLPGEDPVRAEIERELTLLNGGGL